MNVLLPNVAFFLLLFLPFMLSLFGQSAPNKNDDYKLILSVDLVGVLATVTRAEGVLLPGLKQQDFQIHEDGQLLFIALLLLSACGRSSEKPAKAEEYVASTKAATRSGNIVRFDADSPQLTQIRVAAVENVEVPTAELIAPGKVELNPSHMSRVSLPVPGRIRQLQVGLGDRVQQGQPILSLESPEVSAVQSALRQGEANVSQAKVALAKAQADLARVRDAEAVVARSEATLEQALASRDEALRKLRLLGSNRVLRTSCRGLGRRRRVSK